VACTQGFSKPASGTKGPVDLFEGFQQEPESYFGSAGRNDPVTGRSRTLPKGEVGGLHHMIQW
jgi:hypothetical protein